MTDGPESHPHSTSTPHAKKLTIRSQRPAPLAGKSTTTPTSPRFPPTGPGKKKEKVEGSEDKPDMAASFLQFWYALQLLEIHVQQI